MSKKIIAFGEVVWNILPEVKVLGGTPSSVVFRCNSFGGEGYLLSRVGDDELARKADCLFLVCCRSTECHNNRCYLSL